VTFRLDATRSSVVAVCSCGHRHLGSSRLEVLEHMARHCREVHTERETRDARSRLAKERR
jgi:predicted small metal-binding protein